MGNPFVHMELSTDDPKGAKAFYKKVFDWKYDAMGPEMGNYIMVDAGKKAPTGGITAKMSPQQPTAWLPYAEVSSVKKTIAKAAKLGAKIMVPYQPIPGMGAIGVFIDPTGASLGVWEMAAKKPSKKKKGSKK